MTASGCFAAARRLQAGTIGFLRILAIVNNLTDVLTRVQTHPASRIEELLPHRWKPPPPAPRPRSPD